tara:strand:+ start:162 stop:437 length:276 start_codon:yes stop_codon:yes gene_type:complete
MIKWHKTPRNGVTSCYNKDMNTQRRIMEKGLNIEVTSSQYDYLYEVLMEAYSNDVAEQKDWDVQTFDNLLDNVMNAKSTYLSDSTRGILKR